MKRLIKASLATPTNSAIAMGLAGFTTDNRQALAKINKPTLIPASHKAILPQLQDRQKSIPGAKLELFDEVGHALAVTSNLRA